MTCMNPAHELINTYFEIRPFKTTQEAYKRKGLKCFDYWHSELNYILNTSREFEIGPDYYMKKYGPTLRIRDMDDTDRTCILNAFVIQLGMNPATFTFSLKHFRDT